MRGIEPTVEINLDEQVRHVDGRTYGRLGSKPTGRCSEPISETWQAVYEFELTNGTPQLTEVRIIPVDPGRGSASPPTAVELRRIAPSKAARSVRAEMLRKLAKFVSEIDSFGWWEGEFGDPDAVAATRAPRGNSEEHYLRFARLYAEKVGQSRSPVADVHAEVNPNPNHAIYSRAYIRDAIAKAREIGLLTQTVQGKRGGTLTEKARRLLAQQTSTPND